MVPGGGGGYGVRQLAGHPEGPMPLGFEPLHPGGMDENSPAFQRWDCGRIVPSPEGTAESAVFQPSLRDLSHTTSSPSVETLGYFRWSLRDRGAGPIPEMSGPRSRAGNGLSEGKSLMRPAEKGRAGRGRRFPDPAARMGSGWEIGLNGVKAPSPQPSPIGWERGSPRHQKPDDCRRSGA